MRTYRMARGPLLDALATYMGGKSKQEWTDVNTSLIDFAGQQKLPQH